MRAVLASVDPSPDNKLCMGRKGFRSHEDLRSTTGCEVFALSSSAGVGAAACPFGGDSSGIGLAAGSLLVLGMSKFSSSPSSCAGDPK